LQTEIDPVLRKLTITGFKSIRNAEIELGRVNMFIGGNGSGKSNILEALGLLSASLKDISEAELQKRGVRLSLPTLFKSSFKNFSIRPHFVLKADFDASVQYDVSIKSGEQFDSLRFFTENIRYGRKSYMGRGQNGITVRGLTPNKKDIDPTRGLWDRFREAIDLPPALEAELGPMARFAIYAPQTAFLRGTDVEAVPVRPIGLQGGGLPLAAEAVRMARRRIGKWEKRGLYGRVLDLVNAPGWNDGFTVTKFISELVPAQVRTGDATLYFLDKFMKRGRNTLSAYDSSEGTLYLLFMAVMILHPDAPKIFALDNVDNALNPAMTRRMLETLIESTCGTEFRDAGIGPEQVFLTSHNPTALDAFDLFDPDQRVFVVSRKPETGETVISPLRPKVGWSKEDWIKAWAGRTLSELWIEGKITGALGE